MEIVSGLIKAITGGFGSKLVDTVRDYFPPSMSEAEKRELALRIEAAARSHELALMEAAHQAEAEFNGRIKDLEGTAADLKTIPVMGPVILFLRGCQRPAFGFFTLIMDWLVFSGAWTIPSDTRLESAFFAVNLLVLGFLFGERAVKNVMPLFEKMMERK